MSSIFIPHELKTLTIDTEKKSSRSMVRSLAGSVQASQSGVMDEVGSISEWNWTQELYMSFMKTMRLYRTGRGFPILANGWTTYRKAAISSAIPLTIPEAEISRKNMCESKMRPSAHGLL